MFTFEEREGGLAFDEWIPPRSFIKPAPELGLADLKAAE